jgi:hypothetical protein
MGGQRNFGVYVVCVVVNNGSVKRHSRIFDINFNAACPVACYALMVSSLGQNNCST